MVERNIAESLLGGEEPENQEESEISASSIDPIAAVWAVTQSAQDPELTQRLSYYLERQAHLVTVQTEHLHEQRTLQLARLRLRQFQDRLRSAFQILLACIATGLVIGLLIALFDAVSSRSVVVDAFKAPPTLAARGLSGEVIATSVLDGLQRLQSATRASAPGLKTRGAWASEIKIEVPETGISIGEVERLLRDRFGHDVHINGDLVQTESGGLSLTVRGDQILAKAFTGDRESLDHLLEGAAEYIYGESQPVLFATYLERRHRFQEALKFIEAKTSSPISKSELADLVNIWGIVLYQMGEKKAGLDKMRLEMGLVERYSKTWWKAWANIVGALIFTESEERGAQEGRAFISESEKAPIGHKPEPSDLEFPALNAWDFPLALKSELVEARANSGAGAKAFTIQPMIANTYASLHDEAAAVRYLAESEPDDIDTKMMSDKISALLAIKHEKPEVAVGQLESWRALLPNNPNAIAQDLCYLGMAYGMEGRLKEAEAVFKSAGPWSLCYALHGQIFEKAGQQTRADRVWAEGLRRGPDLPAIYLYRGIARMNRGDLPGAQVDLAASSARAPHWADPLKASGDLSALQGHWNDAAAKYVEAAKYAPAWQELREVKAVAERHLN